MGSFVAKPTKIPGAMLIEPFNTQDARGYFVKSFEQEAFGALQLPSTPYECFESYSKRHVLRGLHFVNAPFAQAKTVRAVTGMIYDVIVDLRKASPTYRQWAGFTLSSDNKKMLYIPEGCAHGFVVLSEDSVVSYLCFSRYEASADTGLIWNDETIKIAWPVENTDHLVVSDRDRALPTFHEFEPHNPF